MATLQKKLADSLAALKKYQDAHGDNLVIQGTGALGRTHTERLVSNGYLKMVIKGWYIPSSPGSEGDSMSTEGTVPNASLVRHSSKIPPLKTYSFHPAAIYLSRLPWGTIRMQLSDISMNALSPSSLKSCGGFGVLEITFARLLQSVNTSNPRYLTLDGMVTDVRPLLPNAAISMTVTLLGMFTCVRSLQP